MKRRIFLFILVTGVFLIVGCWGTLMKQAEAQRVPVEIKPTEKRILFFYKDDCPDCKKVFPYVYTKNLLSDSVLFVNLNQKENRLYVSTYQLKSVPTFIDGTKRYSLTEIQRIKEMIKK